MNQKPLRPVLSVRVFREEKCFGPGICKLLQKVDELHSLRAAAASMEMAYSKAWTIVKTSEKHLGFALLQTKAGGKHGGGATLTPQAGALIAAYEDYCSALSSYASRLFPEKFREFL